MIRLALLLLLLFPALADAANRCTLTATGACASRHVTIQEAHDAAAPGDKIVVGPGAYAESVHLIRRVYATFQPGAVLDGEWWDDSNIVVRELRDAVINGRVRVTAGTGWRMIGGSVVCAGGFTEGIVLEAASNPRVMGGTEVTGCAIGIDDQASIGVYLADTWLHGNAVAVRGLNTSGAPQYFRGDYDGNGVAVLLQRAFHTDVNSNVVACGAGGIGFQMDVIGTAVNDTMEYNQNTFTGCAGKHWQIQRCDGTFTNDPTLSPESNAQYGTNTADGVALPVYNTGVGGC